MADAVYKYRVWCVTDSKYVEVWAEEEPTTCPENNGHTIDPDKTTIVEELIQEFPLSDIDSGKKIAVHPTYKPRIEGSETFAVWCGAGDNTTTAEIGGGDLLEFNCVIGTATVAKDMYFHPDNGKVWIHEGYLKFEGGGNGDFLCAAFMSSATPVQQVAALDLEITDNWIHLAAGGPGTGTHGFADPTKIALIPRYFSKDGDWDYDGIDLTPNMSGTGLYKISDVERKVHTFINKIPCKGSSTTYFSMSSDETAALPPNYFIRIMAHNESNTNWNASALVEIYRERTAKP